MQDSLARLTQPHTVIIPDRPVPWEARVTMRPLIEQLRQAIFGEDGRNGGVSESRARLPLSAPALDLYQSIDEWVTEVWAQRFQRVPGIEQPEQLLAEWCAGLTPETLVFYTVRTTVATTKGTTVVSDLTTSTVAEFIHMLEDRIVDLIERPTVQVPVKGPCPAPGCWAVEVNRSVDGELIPGPTLEFTRVQATGDTIKVTCRSCGTEWAREEFYAFTKALAQTERGIKPHQMEILQAAT